MRLSGLCRVVPLVLLAATSICSAQDARLANAVASADWTTAKALASQVRDLRGPVISGYSALITREYRAATTAFARATELLDKDLHGGADALEGLCKQHPRSWPLHLLRADFLVRLGQHDEAIAAANKAVELNGHEALGYHVRGLIHAVAGRDEQALSDFTRAIEIDSKLADAYVARAILRVREGKPEAAQQDAERALQLVPDFAVALNVRGVALCQQGQYEAALKAFTFALDLQQDFSAAAQNLKSAQTLAKRGREKVRIQIVAGRRAGALGTRTLEVVVAEKEQSSEAIAAGKGAVQAATGVEPVVVTDPRQAIEELEKGRRPVVLIVPLSEEEGQTEEPEQPIRRTLERVSQQVPEAEVRVITDGRRATRLLARILEKLLDQGDAPEQLENWDVIPSEEEDPDEMKRLGRAALRLRARGVDVRAYGRRGVAEHLSALLPSEKAAIQFFPVPDAPVAVDSATPPDVLSLVGPQIAASAVAFPEQNRGGMSRLALYSMPGKGLRAYLSGLSPVHPDFGPGGPSIPTGRGVHVGTSRVGSNPQFLIPTPTGDVLIRLDIERPHRQKPHINIQVGKKNIHTDKDGVQLSPDDDVVIKVGGGKIVITVNGEQVKEYDVAEADNEEPIEIERKPNGETTVTVNGEPVGEVETKPDGTIVIRVGDQVIELPPQPSKNDQKLPSNDKQDRNKRKPDNHNKAGDGQNKPKSKDREPASNDGEGQKKPESEEHDKKDNSKKIDIAGTRDRSDEPEQPPRDSRRDPRRRQGVPVLTPEWERKLLKERQKTKPKEYEYIPIMPPKPRPPIYVPPGWIVVPGPDGPVVIPDPRVPPTNERPNSRNPDKRDGVYLVNDQSLEVIDGKNAGTGLLFGRKSARPKRRDVRASLECPFLIFQDNGLER